MAMSWKGMLGTAVIVLVTLFILYRVSALKALVIPVGA